MRRWSLASQIRNLGVVDAFDDCVDRLARGESLQTCLEAYPQYAAELAPMLEAGVGVARAAETDAEWAEIQAEMEARFERVLSNGSVTVRRGRAAWISMLGAVASVLLVMVIALNGLAIVSQDSLPGDTLYGYKRFTESVRLSLADSSGEAALSEEFARRRLTETQTVLNDGREVEVDFTGVVEAVDLGEVTLSDGREIAGFVTVAGLEVTITAQMQVDQPGLMQILRPGLQVNVRAVTTTDRRLVASTIVSVEPQPPTPEPTPTVIAIPSLTPSETPRASVTLTVTPTVMATPTLTTSATYTPMSTVARAAATSTMTVTGSVDVCVTRPPQGWAAYIIQTGDTLSDLALRSGGTVEAIMRMNCLEDPRRIIAGTRIYLPRYPVRRAGDGNGSEPITTLTPDNPPGEDLQGTLRATQATHVPIRPPATPTPGRGRR